MAAELAAARPAARRGRPAAGLSRGALLVLPALLFLAIFFLVPLLLMAKASLEGNGLGNYVDVLTSHVYLRVLWTTCRTALVTTAGCLLLGYPYAYVMHRAGHRLRLLLLGLVLLPFWASLLVRSFSWLALLQDTGLINQTLIKLGIIDQPLALVRSPLGVAIGMIHVMLPYMLLPVYTSMTRIDPILLRAAESLGATPVRRFLRVFAPLSLPGVLAGSILVFVLSLGFFITPALLGDPRQAMLGELIANQVQHGAFSRASTLGIVLLLSTLVALAVLAALANARNRRTRGRQA